MKERDLYERYPHYPAIKRLIVTIIVCAAIIWLCQGVFGCAEQWAKYRADWISACEADGNKRYQCVERWELMQRSGE